MSDSVARGRAASLLTFSILCWEYPGDPRVLKLDGLEDEVPTELANQENGARESASRRKKRSLDFHARLH